MEGNETNMNQEQDTNVQQPTTQAQVGRPAESETQNLDVLLQDPKLQAEFDKKLEKAINTALTKKEQEYTKRESALQASISTEKEKMRANSTQNSRAVMKSQKNTLSCSRFIPLLKTRTMKQ